MGKIFRKAFDIELNDPLIYPSANTICQTISEKVRDIEFINKEKPIAFKNDNMIFEVEIKMAHGGYILICKETE